MASALDTSKFTSGPEHSTPVEYNARDLILYSLGIGSTDPRFTYENHPDFAAFPTYPIVLFFKGDSFDTLSFPSETMMAFPQVPLKGVKVGLDAEKIIEKVNELPKGGAKLKLVGSTVGCHKKGSGALVEQELRIVDEAGKVYYRLVNGSFLVGAKDFTDSGKTCSQAATPPKEAPTHTIEDKTSETIPSLYRLSGDYNPLHVDPQFAQMGGFPKPIMHGQCTMGHVARSLLDTVAGGDQRRFRSIQLRFASPVFPGETLVTEAWKVSPTEFIFQTKVKETGKVCVNNGRLVLNAEAKL
jgi:acyl dehydratase